jgi:hypothetical protein
MPDEGYEGPRAVIRERPVENGLSRLGHKCTEGRDGTERRSCSGAWSWRASEFTIMDRAEALPTCYRRPFAVRNCLATPATSCLSITTFPTSSVTFSVESRELTASSNRRTSSLSFSVRITGVMFSAF